MLRPEHFIMYAIGGLLIYLAIAKDYEPMLLLPIGLGAILPIYHSTWFGSNMKCPAC